MPYHDPNRPFVNHWYASAEGSDVNSFNQRIAESQQDRLEAEGGACIMYTHFGRRFTENGEPEPQFRRLMERLSQKNGWFVPVSTLLDYLLDINNGHVITRRERNRLERTWLQKKFRVGPT